jgi:RNase P subunit RPR2
MKILKDGDRKRAACNKCQAFEPITFKLRDVPFSDASGIVKNVLVGVCDSCDTVVALPH